MRVKKYKRQYIWPIHSAQWPTGAAQSMSNFRGEATEQNYSMSKLRQEAPGKNSHAGNFCLWVVAGSLKTIFVELTLKNA